jgi:hypothetical protein
MTLSEKLVSTMKMLDTQEICLTYEKIQYPPTHWSQKFQISTSNVPCYIHRVRKTSMPKLLEAIGWTKTKMYCQATVCRRCILAQPWTIKVGLPKVGNKAKPLRYSEEKLYFIPI